MKNIAGLWIDHRNAVIVLVKNGEEELRRVESHMEKHVRFTDGSSDSGSGEDSRDRKFGNHLNKYYDELIDAFHNADSLLIFGPGEAKAELAKRMEQKNVKTDVLAMETADKMTDPQILAKVRKHFNL